MALASTSWKPGQSGNPGRPLVPPKVFDQFISMLCEAHTPSWAAKALGHHRDTFYDHRNTDPAFARDWDYARTEGRADWYEERLRGRASGDEKGDTLSDIIGLKMTGRFIEPQYQAKQPIQINVNVGLEARYTTEQLEAMLRAVEQAQVVDGQVRELPMIESDSDDRAQLASGS